MEMNLFIAYIGIAIMVGLSGLKLHLSRHQQCLVQVLLWDWLLYSPLSVRDKFVQTVSQQSDRDTMYLAIR